MYFDFKISKLRRLISTLLSQKSGRCTFKCDAYATRNCVFEGENIVYEGSSLASSYIGFGTYIGPLCDINSCTIGRYSSLGQRVVCAIGAHPTRDFVSTHPSFYSTKMQCGFAYTQVQRFEENPKLENSKYSIEIGNDVWIGANVTLLGGVHIGNGAIIGAGTIVYHDIPSYSIVIGAPLRITRMRFPKETCARLEEACWWNRKPEWLRDNCDAFNNVDLLLSRLDCDN